MSGSNAWAAELILVANPWTASQFYPAGTSVLAAIDIPSWTTATRPASPNIGRTGFNTTLGLLDQWTGSTWQQYVGNSGLASLLAAPPPIGGTTPSTGAFTALSASSTVSGAGFINYFASPPSIGSTTPGAGAFTTLAASSTVSGTGFSTYLASPPAIGGTTPAAGAFTTLSATSTITPSQTAGIVGTTTNNNANAGSVGEFVSSTVAAGSAVALTTNTTANVTSISLTAGDWDVTGTVGFVLSATSGNTQAGINTTSATIPTPTTATGLVAIVGPTVSSGTVLPVPSARISVASTTTVFLVGFASFTGTGSAFGVIAARRVR